MLSLVREHAAELLDDERETRRRPTTRRTSRPYVEDLYERRWTDAAGRWLDDITEMLPEVRAAHDWARRTGDVPLTARITAALGAYWHLEGHHAEGLRWVGEMLAREDELDPAVSARIRLAAGFLAFPGASPRHAATGSVRPCCFASSARPGTWPTRCAVESATYLSEPEQYERAMRINDEALALGRSVGGPALIAQVLNVRGELTRVAGEDGLARAGVRGGPADLQHHR